MRNYKPLIPLVFSLPMACARSLASMLYIIGIVERMWLELTRLASKGSIDGDVQLRCGSWHLDVSKSCVRNFNTRRDETKEADTA